MSVQIANVGAAKDDTYRDIYQDRTFGWIIENPDKTGDFRNQLLDEGSTHDYIDLNEGRDFLKETRKYDIVILHNLYHPVAGENPRQLGFYGVSPKHSISEWRRKLADTGATVIAALGDFGGPEIRDIPGYDRYSDRGGSTFTYYVKKNTHMAARDDDPHEIEMAKDRQSRLNAARQEPEYLLPNLSLPPQYLRKIDWDGSDVVTVWRSIPPDAKDAQVRPGDWVALTKSYAQSLGRGKLVSKRVKALDLYWAGTDMNEWFYTPVGGRKLACDLAQKIAQRYAAIIEPPPRMVDELTKLVTRYWAAQEYEETKLPAYKTLKGRAPALKKNQSVKKKIQVNLSGWKYGSRKIHNRIQKRIRVITKLMYDSGSGESRAINEKLFGKLDDQIRKMIQQTKTVEVVIYGGVGGPTWSPLLERLSFYIGGIESKQDLVASVTHELRHFAQSLLSNYIHGLLGGPYALPSRKILTPQFSKSLFDMESDARTEIDRIQLQFVDGKITKQVAQKAIHQVEKEYKEMHHLQDIEFETDLGDAIDEFLHAAKGSIDSTEEKKMAIQLFTAQAVQMPKGWTRADYLKWRLHNRGRIKSNSFFETIKTHAPKKYKAALKKFYQVVAPTIRLAAKVAARYQNKKKVKNQDGNEQVVYEYSDRQIQDRHRKKAERLEKLQKAIPKLNAQVKRHLGAEDEKQRLTALAVALINTTYERVGNPQSAAKGHYGVTGWLTKHVKFPNRNKAEATYVGKSGVHHTKAIEDKAIIKALKQAIEGKKGEDQIFMCAGGVDCLSPTDVNEYLQPFEITAKDLRGYRANEEMKIALAAHRKGGPELPRDRKERDKILKTEFKKALENTAKVVGHTPAMLRSDYLVPGLEADYLKDGTIKADLKKKASGTAQKIFIMRSTTPWASHMKYDHIGFVLTNGKLHDMSGHRYTKDGKKPLPPVTYNWRDLAKEVDSDGSKLFDVSLKSTGAARDAGVNPFRYKEIRLPKPVSVPNGIACNISNPKDRAVNCGSFVKIVLYNNGIDLGKAGNGIEDIAKAVQKWRPPKKEAGLKKKAKRVVARFLAACGIMPFPPEYRESLLSDQKNVTIRTDDEKGIYLEGGVYEAQSYEGEPWGITLEVQEVLPVRLIDLPAQGIPIEDVVRVAEGSDTDQVDLIKFNVIPKG